MPIIISNYANDIIEYKNNSIIDGWPALYIEKYFKDNNLNYELLSWEYKWEVFIFNNNWNDVGVIKFAPEIDIVNSLKSDYFIISTLLDEFELIKTKKLDWLLFCDIQWYIRELNSSNRVLLDELPWIENIDFLKVADYEFQFITNNFITNYINLWWTIIVTTWSKWIIKIINNTWENIINIPVWNFADTIWAWDTFLASFADFYFKIRNIEKSIIKSSNYVYNFLREKNNI